MIDAMQGPLFTPAQREAMRKAQEARSGTIFAGHMLVVFGYLVLFIVLFHGWLSLAAFLMAFGAQILVAQQFWKG